MHSRSFRTGLVPVITMLLVLALASGCQRGSEGVSIVWTSQFGPSDPPTQHPMYLDAHRFRYDLVLDGEVVQKKVFDAGAQRFYTIDERNMAYEEVTVADLDVMRQDLEKDQSAAQSPAPAPQSSWQELLQGFHKAHDAADSRSVGKATVSGIPCTRYEVSSRVVTVPIEVCIAARSDVPLPSDDFAVAREWREFVKRGYPGGSVEPTPIGLAGFLTAAKETFGIDGVLMKATRSELYPFSLEITKISRQGITDSTFAVPSGFTKREPIPQLGISGFWRF